MILLFLEEYYPIKTDIKSIYYQARTVGYTDCIFAEG